VNLLRPLSRGCWLVETGLDQVIGVIVQVDRDEFVVHVRDGEAVGFSTSEDAIQYASTVEWTTD